MNTILLIAFSVAIQLVPVVLSIRLLRVARSRKSWVIMAVAFFLMTLKRVSDLFFYLLENNYKIHLQNYVFDIIISIFFIIALILTPVIATIIQLAISRRREYLADASGALLTRYPEGLLRALEKLRDNTQPMRKAASSTAHLFIDNPFKKKGTSFFVNLFSTHPPIEERIKILKSM